MLSFSASSSRAISRPTLPVASPGARIQVPMPRFMLDHVVGGCE